METLETFPCIFDNMEVEISTPVQDLHDLMQLWVGKNALKNNKNK